MLGLWILSEHGLVLYHACKDGSIDAHLFAGFLSAANTIAMQLDDDGLGGIELGTTRITISRSRGLLFIGLHDKRVKEKRVAADMRAVTGKFFSMYPPAVIDGWNGNARAFAAFDQVAAITIE